MWEKQVRGSAHCGDMGTLAGRCLDADASILPQLWWWEGDLGVGGVLELLGCLFPPRGVAWECTDVQNEVTFGLQAYDVSLSVLCRTTEQGCHLQSALLFPRLPPGKVCSCS